MRTNEPEPSPGPTLHAAAEPELAHQVAAAVAALEDALASPDLVAVAESLAALGTAAAAAQQLVHEVTERRESLAGLLDLKARLTHFGVAPEGTELERYLVLHCALGALRRLPREPLAADVKRLLCEEYVRLARPRSSDGRAFRVGPGAFVAVCKMATLRRFPGGQFDWEVSGIPRSWLLRLRGFDIVRLTHYVWRRLGGRGPVFFRHMGVRRPLVLSEAAANQSYLRMADSLRLQPHVRGLVACSWLCSPDTHRVSPHLAWLNRTICDNGGVVVRAGPADPRSGVLARSPERRQLYESGTFRPTLGLLVWDRRSMLAWAERCRPATG